MNLILEVVGQDSARWTVWMDFGGWVFARNHSQSEAALSRAFLSDSFAHLVFIYGFELKVVIPIPSFRRYRDSLKGRPPCVSRYLRMDYGFAGCQGLAGFCSRRSEPITAASAVCRDALAW